MLNQGYTQKRKESKKMRLAEAKTYKEYYAIVEIDGILRNMVTSKGITKFGYIDESDILAFEKQENAERWIKNHSYKGMSFKYEIVKIWNSKVTKYRWEIKTNKLPV